MRQVNFPRTGVPVFKEGEKHDPRNYRPVFLTAVLFKIMEHIIHNNIMHHLENTEWHLICEPTWISEKSFMWISESLILTVEDLAKNLDHGDQMDMIILDFSEALDEVPHQRLIRKLQFYGIQGSILISIKSWLTSRSQSVIIDGECSKSVDVTSGVPEGTVLGPLMFLLFIDDI